MVGQDFEMLNKEDLDNLDTQHMKRKQQQQTAGTARTSVHVIKDERVEDMYAKEKKKKSKRRKSKLDGAEGEGKDDKECTVF